VKIKDIIVDSHVSILDDYQIVYIPLHMM